MFGTGECASSARESTRPSCTSSSWRSGTYCRQIGSPGDVMSSTMAGEMRNSKFSAACRSRYRSGKCSAVNAATSASREATLRLRRRSCQDSIAQVLEVDHQVVSGGVITREPGGRRVAAPLVERAGGRVFGAGRCLDDNQSSVVSRQSLLHSPQERAPHALALPRGVHDDPVEVVGAGGAGGRTPAGVADELVARVRAQEAVVLVAGEAVVEQLHGDGDLVRPEQAGGRGEPLKPCALRVADGPRSEEHTSELQSRLHLVCRLLLEKKKTIQKTQEVSNDYRQALH